MSRKLMTKFATFCVVLSSSNLYSSYSEHFEEDDAQVSDLFRRDNDDSYMQDQSTWSEAEDGSSFTEIKKKKEDKKKWKKKNHHKKKHVSKDKQKSDYLNVEESEDEDNYSSEYKKNKKKDKKDKKHHKKKHASKDRQKSDYLNAAESEYEDNYSRESEKDKKKDKKHHKHKHDKKDKRGRKHAKND